MICAVKALLCAGALCVTSQYRDGFKVAWQNDEDASSSVLQLCRAKPVPDKSDELKSWSFDSVANPSGSLDDSIAATFSSLWPGLEGELLSVVERTNGLVQVGTTAKRGFLRISDVPSSVEDVFFRARIRNISAGPKRLNIYSIDSTGATNAVRQVYLTDQLCEYSAPVSNAVAIVFATNVIRYPPQFADIRLVADYRPAYVSTNTVMYANAGLGNSGVFYNLEPGDYLWRVESRFADGAPPVFSPFLDVSLSSDDSPLPLGFTIRVR